MPKVDVRVLTEDYCEFVLSETDASVATALRRVGAPTRPRAAASRLFTQFAYLLCRIGRIEA